MSKLPIVLFALLQFSSGVLPADGDKAAKLDLKEDSANIEAKLLATDPKDSVRQQPCKVYRVDLKEGRSYQIDMMSKELDAYLRLEDPSGKELAKDDDSGAGTDARIIFVAPKEGAYRIVASTFSGGAGSFSLSIKPAIVAKPITLALKKGEIEAESELTNQDAKDAIRKISACKIYSVKFVKGKSYQIDMTSAKVDSYLRLEDAGGKELAKDDDSGGMFNARIVFACKEDGDYRVIATTFLGDTGPFRLRIKEK